MLKEKVSELEAKLESLVKVGTQLDAELKAGEQEIRDLDGSFMEQMKALQEQAKTQIESKQLKLKQIYLTLNETNLEKGKVEFMISQIKEMNAE